MNKMTIKGEFSDIFVQWDKKTPLDEVYFQILKWLSKYKNIVKHQPSIKHILKRLYLLDMNQESSEYIKPLRNPIITVGLKEFIEDFVFGEIYQSLRNEMLD